MSCKCCSKFPNTVLVFIIDEDGETERIEDLYSLNFQDTGRTVFSQYTNYCRSLFEGANLEGFAGIIFVPVLPRNRPDELEIHPRMIQRMNDFKNSMPEPFLDKIIITPEVNRNSDYSQLLIDSIESLRFIDDPENPIDIDYIVTEVDSSGSHTSEQFDSTFLNYYTRYSSDISIETLLGLNIQSDYVKELSPEHASGFPSNEEPGTFSSYGLTKGVGTKHIIRRSLNERTEEDDGSRYYEWNLSAENWLTPIHNFLLLLAGYVNNRNRGNNCNLICRHRWTTFEGNLLLPIFPYDFFYSTSGSGPARFRDGVGSILPYILEDDDQCGQGLYLDGCQSAYNELSNLGPDFDVFSFIDPLEAPYVGEEYLVKTFFWPDVNQGGGVVSGQQAGEVYWLKVEDLKPTNLFSDSPHKYSGMVVLEQILNSLIFLRDRGGNYGGSVSTCPCNYFHPMNQYYEILPKE